MQIKLRIWGRHRHSERAARDNNAERSKRKRPPDRVQIIGGYLEDRSTIAFAGLIEREFGGFTPPSI